MTDTTTETTPAKPIWIRCKGRYGQSNGCSQRVFNDNIDIELHKKHCPADLEREVDKLEKRIAKLEKTEIVIPEQVDLDDVADDWPTDDEQQPEEELDVASAVAPATQIDTSALYSPTDPSSPRGFLG